MERAGLAKTASLLVLLEAITVLKALFDHALFIIQKACNRFYCKIGIWVRVRG